MFKMLKSKLQMQSVIAALIMGIVMSVGNVYFRHNTITKFSLLDFLSMLIWFFATLVICEFFFRKYKAFTPKKHSKSKFFDNKFSSLYIFGIIFAVFLIAYLSYYPGIVSYDIGKQYFQASGLSELTSFHPVLHTLLFRFCLWIGGNFKGMMISYSLISMTFMSVVFTAVIWYLGRFKAQTWIKIVALLWVVLIPQNALISFVPAKDTFFAGFFILFLCELFEILRSKGGKLTKLSTVRFIVFGAFACLLRNNALYAFILFAVIFLIVFKKYFIRFAAVLGIAVLVSYIIFPLAGVLGTDAHEVLSLPAQQIANVASKLENEFLYDNSANMMFFFPKGVDKYNPRYADPIKDQIVIDERTSMGDFIRLWGGLLVNYPVDYIDAAATLNLAYWYPDTEYPDENSSRIYIETYVYPIFEERLGFKQEPVLPFRDYYESFAGNCDWQNVPVLKQLFGIGTPIFVCVFGILLCFVKKQRRKALVFILPACLWLTFMAGPVSNFRYIYPIFAAYPLLLGTLFIKEKE